MFSNLNLFFFIVHHSQFEVGTVIVFEFFICSLLLYHLVLDFIWLILIHSLLVRSHTI